MINFLEEIFIVKKSKDVFYIEVIMVKIMFSSLGLDRLYWKNKFFHQRLYENGMLKISITRVTLKDTSGLNQYYVLW